jgi:septal ring factor EnvC (AmiA/AmiB activator)
MWTAIKRACLLAALSFCVWSPLGFCAEASEAETVPKELLMRALKDWEQSNGELLRLLDAQAEDLTIASSELESLRNTLQKQNDALQALKNDLITARTETQTARESLNEANRELQNTVQCVKDLEHKKARCERQRNFWEVVAAVLGVVCIAK